MQTWNELSEIEQLLCIYSDCFKEAHGFRPRHPVDGWTVQDFNEAIAACSEIAQQQMEAENAAEIRNIQKVEETIIKLISYGAENRETAIKWLADAEDVDGDMDYLCYKLGIPYKYFG